MKFAKHIFLVLLVSVSGVSSALAADRITTIPVHFASGSSSATLKGSFTGYDSVRYTIAARAGQTMTVGISGSTNANFNVLPAGDIPGQTTAIGSGFVGESWTQELPVSGTYMVEVYQMRASARRGKKVSFTLHIEISGKVGHASRGAVPAARGSAMHTRSGKQADR